MQDRLQQQMDFLIEIDKSKTILRQTLLADSSRRENDAEHSWHLAMAAMVLAEHAAFPIDLNHVIRMVLVHDLVEIDAGDTFAYDVAAHADKAAREQAAADRLFGMLPSQSGQEMRALWEEFEQCQTPDAQFAAAMDRIQPFMNNVATQGHTWRLGKVRASQVFERMQPIQTATPALWPYICRNIALGVQNGWLQGDMELPSL